MDREKEKLETLLEKNTDTKRNDSLFFHLIAFILCSFTLDKVQFISYTNLKISNITKVLLASVYTYYKNYSFKKFAFFFLILSTYL